MKIVSLFWNLVPGLIRICRIPWWCLIFLFLIGIILLGEIWSKKNQICLFKLNFGTQTNSNMQNSMMRFILSATDFKYHFTGNLVQKILCLNWIWYLDYFEYAELNGMVHLICFRLEIPFLGKFGSKNQNS